MSCTHPDDIWEAGRYLPLLFVVVLRSELYQDTHVPRSGRDLIRLTLEDANLPVSVSISHCYCDILKTLSL